MRMYLIRGAVTRPVNCNCFIAFLSKHFTCFSERQMIVSIAGCIQTKALTVSKVVPKPVTERSRAYAVQQQDWSLLLV